MQEENLVKADIKSQPVYMELEFQLQMLFLTMSEQRSDGMAKNIFKNMKEEKLRVKLQKQVKTQNFPLSLTLTGKLKQARKLPFWLIKLFFQSLFLNLKDWKNN